MSSTAHADLAKILIPSLFLSILKLTMPWNPQGPLNFHEVGQYTFKDQPPTGAQWEETCFPALKALSQIPLSELPGFMSFLAPPESRAFPGQALGLVLLIDQGPRRIFKGVQVRWIKEFFDIISVKLTKQLLALGDLRPDRKERWVGELNTSFDVWIVSRMWFVAPLVHSESLDDQDLARDIVEGLRVEVEKETGTTDPYRLKQDEITKDTLAFPRVIKIGPPVGQDVSMADFIFWLWTVLDIHRPIIEVYGRYPYPRKVF